jgi:hypothetical protein
MRACQGQQIEREMLRVLMLKDVRWWLLLQLQQLENLKCCCLLQSSSMQSSFARLVAAALSTAIIASRSGSCKQFGTQKKFERAPHATLGLSTSVGPHIPA